MRSAPPIRTSTLPIASPARNCTTEMHFVDTNVLIYAISEGASDRRKWSIARRILRDDDCAISVQVLQEFYTQATRATRLERLSHEEALIEVKELCQFPV